MRSRFIQGWRWNCSCALIWEHRGLESVVLLRVHKSIYRHMHLWLEIDFMLMFFENITELRIAGENT